MPRNTSHKEIGHIDGRTAKRLAREQELEPVERETTYTPPFPIDMRKRFWEHDLNPITGYKAVKSNYDPDGGNARATEWSLGSGAKCNGASII